MNNKQCTFLKLVIILTMILLLEILLITINHNKGNVRVKNYNLEKKPIEEIVELKTL